METLYTTRSSARRAANAACRKTLNAPHYQASEGPDFLIYPRSPTIDNLLDGIYRDRYYFVLRGPAKDAAQ